MSSTKPPEAPLRGLSLRKHADKTRGERLVRYDPVTGEKKLVNPATPGDDHEPWPLAGVEVLDAPERTTLTTQFVAQGIAEGWLTGDNARGVVRPAGPRPDVFASTHTGQAHSFIHYDRLTIHQIDGTDVVYRVVHQPDKYADGSQANDGPMDGGFDDDTKVTEELYNAGATRVDNFYGLEKES